MLYTLNCTREIISELLLKATTHYVLTRERDANVIFNVKSTDYLTLSSWRAFVEDLVGIIGDVEAKKLRQIIIILLLLVTHFECLQCCFYIKGGQFYTSASLTGVAPALATMDEVPDCLAPVLVSY